MRGRRPTGHQVGRLQFGADLFGGFADDFDKLVQRAEKLVSIDCLPPSPCAVRNCLDAPR